MKLDKFFGIIGTKRKLSEIARASSSLPQHNDTLVFILLALVLLRVVSF